MKRLSRSTALIACLAPASVLLSACGQGSFTASGIIVQTLDSRPSTCPFSRDEVVIMDAEGKDLAFGNLSSSEVKSTREDDGTKWGNYTNECTYTFDVPDVESGHDIYKMTIGGQEAPRQTEDDLASGISLTFG